VCPPHEIVKLLSSIPILTDKTECICMLIGGDKAVEWSAYKLHINQFVNLRLCAANEDLIIYL
jgi:hypothetical protein